MSPTRRTQQSRREGTIGKLVASAIDCINELGYQGASVQIICQRAELSQGALFRHFATKNELMQLVYNSTIDLLFDRATVDLAALPPEASDEDKMVCLMRSLVADVHYVVLMELMMAARTQPELSGLLTRDGLRQRDRFIAVLGTYFPRYAGNSEFVAMALTMMTTYHGMSLYRSMSREVEPSPLREQWLQSIMRQELSRLAKKGADTASPVYDLAALPQA
ncbi:TetR/AcrR family transcriptional regulator [Craterilacuibacter sp.]|uniref:TetR/AcrR family transcriptional regulator n=1 Tax=Craterilacuibacter sp. TaxID=2870909 RepID=UPI003F35E6DF